MCVELTDIGSEECGEVAGGLVELYWAYANDIETIPAADAAPDDNVISTNITMKATKYFRKITFDEDAGKIDFNIVGDKSALSVKAMVEVDISKITAVKSRMFDGTLNARLVLVGIDANAKTYLIGSNTGRAARRVAATSTTGTALEDKNHDKIIFDCSIGRRIFYTGVIPTEPVV